jgi:integrase
MHHTAATLMMAAGMQMHDVSAILGHASPAVTAQIYAQSVREQRRKATHVLADALAANKRAAV